MACLASYSSLGAVPVSSEFTEFIHLSLLLSISLVKKYCIAVLIEAGGHNSYPSLK